MIDGIGQNRFPVTIVGEDSSLSVIRQFFRDRKLGASLAFYTSNGRVLKLSGTWLFVALCGVMILHIICISVLYIYIQYIYMIYMYVCIYIYFNSWPQ